jgi:ABC-2 type transport system permease protein
MIPTMLRLAFINLRRDKVAWLLGFVVPIAMFSIFAVIFGGMGPGKTPAVSVAVVDEDGSEFSRRLIAGLRREESLRVRTSADDKNEGPPLTRETGRELVATGKVPVTIVLPKGIGGAFPNFDGRSGATIEVLADNADPVAPQMVTGLLQKVVMMSLPDVFMEGGIAQFEKFTGGLTETQRKAINEWLPQVKKQAESMNQKKPTDAQPETGAGFGMIPVKLVDVIGERQQKNKPVIAFYAAGTAVMFLLFTCANGGGGSFLEEVESGTLDRLLSTRLGMTQLLVSKWLWFTLMGITQVTVMFLWGAAVFGVDLFGHLLGFLIMAVTTAAAAASFGLILGTLCKTRGQLHGGSTAVIIIMSAVGGSMFPRFLMPDFMKSAGLFTFNAWALDGFQKVFWYDVPTWQLWPQVGVLVLLTAAFLIAARVFARRWEVM